MPIQPDSIEWSLKHLAKLGDSDLFPKPIELDPLLEKIDDVKIVISSREPNDFAINPARRFMVPKDEFSFRRATQLNIFDSIILTSIIYEYGHGIENRRIPIDQKRVYSNRLAPQHDFMLYNKDYGWNQFWQQCQIKSAEYSHAAVLDISDFYNQIYHHTIENQLGESGFPNSAIKWTIKLLESLTSNVSRGVPVGPHAAHLLAEASLIPLDNSLASHGIEFIRFVDDIIIFDNSDINCRKRIYQLADILDKQQRLILNNSKTQLLTSAELRNLCSERIEDRPINDLEKDLLEVIKRYSGNNPYQTVLISTISADDLVKFNKDTIEKILQDYLDSNPVDFIRFRWFLRRLTQVGHPGAVEYCLKNLELLTPAIADICHYFLSASQNLNGVVPEIGGKLLEALNNEIIKTNEYFQICILSLFSRNARFNHFASLQDLYNRSSSFIKREIILSAHCAKNSDWLRELKESYNGLDPWAASAFIVAIRNLPLDERKYFINKLTNSSELIDILKKWSKEK